MKVQQNVGSIGRIARIAIGIASAAVALSGAVAGPAVYVAWFVLAVPLTVGLVMVLEAFPSSQAVASLFRDKVEPHPGTTS